jgi:hypothetical protein
VTEGKITHRQVWETDKIREWMFKNAEAIIQRSGTSKTIKSKGTWVVTKTYTAKRGAIAVLRSKNSKTYFGISASTHGVDV